MLTYNDLPFFGELDKAVEGVNDNVISFFLYDVLIDHSHRGIVNVS